MLTDYHVHMHETGYFSTNYLRQYIEKAKEKGIEELGISEHAYFFNETKNIISNPWIDNRRGLDFNDYWRLFEEAEKENLKVKMGIEMDYTPGKEEEMEKFIKSYPFDYVIGSVHWIGDWGIDLQMFRDEYEKRDIYEAYERYFDQIVTLAESKLFDVVGHIDLIKIFGYKPDDQAFVEEQYDRAVEALAKSGTCIEISTAGLRKPVGEIYPDPVLLQKCYDNGVGIVLCSDAHAPKHVGYAYDQSLDLARSAGYDKIQTFTKRKKKSCSLGDLNTDS
ncbi:histidinol-phosphatase (PHP family) [Melghiribacillus thermohalophilus]|uniref:Histidinol-phosphatase n=1 Tax=Melghiribacillus thermohalophilus TaxID=1324956 RepID=A0A4V2V218_9BACI|nr:histidinol-phosphatase HisJ family protein [Melghiribacillus thermohalophilus]TCT23312.1 histidinol-phosphatase (PHP family) [Melghiribacillus thermohalophilus]